MRAGCVSLIVAVGAAANVASAIDINSVNSLKSNVRHFNDFGDSVLTVTPAPVGGGIAGTSVRLDEGPFNPPTGGSFANKHRFFLSNDGGSSIFELHQQQPFELQVNYRLTTSYTGTQPGVNRKEGAIEVYVPLINDIGVRYYDEGRFLVATKQQGTLDEIAVFGGTMPFTGFGNVYMSGDLVRLRMIYVPGDGVPTTGPQATLQTGISFDGGTTWNMGAVQAWGDTRADGFTTGTQIAFVGQNSPITPGDPAGLNQTVSHEWNGVSIVPAPSALALLGLGGLAMGRRRR